MTLPFNDVPQVVSPIIYKSAPITRTTPDSASIGSARGGFCSVTGNLHLTGLHRGSCVSQRSPGYDSPPACNTFFRYLGSGKIFLHDAEDVGRRSRTNPAHRRIEYFWLCGKCCSAMHLMRGRDGAVRILSLPCLPILMSL
jgi:hypothetical protein